MVFQKKSDIKGEPGDYEIQPKRYYGRDRFFLFQKEFEEIDDDAKVLNLGCGRGESLRNKFKRGIGIDFNPGLVELWSQLGIADRCFVQDARKLSFKDNEFDWSISTDFFEHIPQSLLHAVKKETLRVAPRGIHVIDLSFESHYRGTEGQTLHAAQMSYLAWMEFWGDDESIKTTSFDMRSNQIVVKYLRH